ncbi:MAG: hypothetical protein J6D47_11300 [Peptostreptococcaceae bacterium]|nr:hypothetical protein [Peptostreptococcaceae bacterium]
MINKIQFEGINKGLIFENNKMIKFKLENIGNSKKNKTALITCFKDEHFNLIKDNKEKTILIDGEFYETSYKDKNDNWINGYCINAKNITLK